MEKNRPDIISQAQISEEESKVMLDTKRKWYVQKQKRILVFELVWILYEHYNNAILKRFISCQDVLKM